MSAKNDDQRFRTTNAVQNNEAVGDDVVIATSGVVVHLSTGSHRRQAAEIAPESVRRPPATDRRRRMIVFHRRFAVLLRSGDCFSSHYVRSPFVLFPLLCPNPHCSAMLLE